jgi:MFS family permease
MPIGVLFVFYRAAAARSAKLLLQMSQTIAAGTSSSCEARILSPPRQFGAFAQAGALCGPPQRSTLRQLIPPYEVATAIMLTRKASGTRMLVLACGNALMIIVSIGLIPTLPAMARHFGSVLLAQIILMSPVPLKIVGAPIAAMLMRRFGRRRSFIGCSLLLGLSGIAAIFSSCFWMQLPLRLVMGFAGAAIATVAATLAGDYFEGTERDRAVSWLGIGPTAGAVLGFFVGGLIAQLLGWQWAYALFLLAFPVAAAAWVLLPEPQLTQSALPGLPRQALLQPVLPEPPAASLPGHFGALLGLAGFASFISVFGGYQLPFLLADSGLESAAFSGLLLASSSVVASIAAALYPALRKLLGSPGVFSWIAGVCGLAYCLQSLVSGRLALALLVPLVGVGGGLMFPFCTGAVVERASAAARPRAAGFVMSAIFTGQLVSPFLAEPIRNLYGPRAALGAIGALAIAVGLAVAIARLKKPVQPTAAQ